MDNDLTISIVNYNQSNLLEQCLSSIFKETSGITFEVFVVDNASTDDSVKMVKTKFPQVNLIVNDKNLFFAKAHNKALRLAKSRYVCILNNDTIILDNAFAKIIKFMDENTDCGACGPQLLNPDRTIQHSCDRFPSFTYGIFEALLINAIFPNNSVKKYKTYNNWNHNTIKKVDFVGGACIVVRKEVCDSVGLLDENFALFWEETDWCLRMKKSGWNIYYFPEAKIIHYWGKGMQKLGKRKTEKIYHNSMMYYYKKNYSYLAYLIIKLCILVSVPVVSIVRFIKYDILRK